MTSNGTERGPEENPNESKPASGSIWRVNGTGPPDKVKMLNVNKDSITILSLDEPLPGVEQIRLETAESVFVIQCTTNEATTQMFWCLVKAKRGEKIVLGFDAVPPSNMFEAVV